MVTRFPRRVFHMQLRLLYFSSRSTFSSHRVCFADNNQMDRLVSNPFFDKYAAKIQAFQRSSPDEFMARVSSATKKKDANVKHDNYSERSTAKSTLSSYSYSRTKTLDAVMKVDLIKDKSSNEIVKIWKEYHEKQDKIAAVIPGDVYSALFANSKKFPTFLYPLPRESGYEFFVAQFSDHECHFTSLINYQAHKENAPECLTIFHYPEFQEEKGIVLMHGEYDKDVMTGRHAQCLANQLQMYYTSSPGDRKFKILDAFTNSPNGFKHVDLINELTNISF